MGDNLCRDPFGINIMYGIKSDFHVLRSTFILNLNGYSLIRIYQMKVKRNFDILLPLPHVFLQVSRPKR